MHVAKSAGQVLEQKAAQIGRFWHESGDLGVDTLPARTSGIGELALWGLGGTCKSPRSGRHTAQRGISP